MTHEYRRIAFLFPGQGAQVPGMGKEFVQAYRVAAETFEEADDRLGMRLSHLVFEGSKEVLTETCHSQPAIFVTSIAILRVLQHLFPNLLPFACAGLSLGEYSALTASGRLSFSSCLPIVRQRADAMHAACLEKSGSMAVVIGLDGDQVMQQVEALHLPSDLWVANLNCPGQVVISGTRHGIEVGTAALIKRGAKRVLPLQVGGAFHSGLMRSAEEKLTPILSVLPLQPSAVRLAMNVTGEMVTDDRQIRQQLIHQVTRPVRWEQSIRTLMREGVDLFLEIGPGKTLSGINKRIGVLAPTISIERVDELKQCEEWLYGSAAQR